jgi:quinol monooxygenase YgiN
VIASVRFKPQRRVDGARMFEKIARAVEVEEPGAYTYLFTADTQDEGLMWNFERYEDERYLRQIHAPRDDVQQNMREQQEMRQPGGLHHWYWKQIAEVQNPGL